MKALGIIPARYGSTRLPGKPLELIGGLPMVHCVWLAAVGSKLDGVVVATDNSKIFDYCQSQSINVVLTSSKHLSGTDRIIEVMEMPEYSDYDVYVNIQGDEPLLKSADIDKLVEAIYTNETSEIATLVTDLDYSEMKKRSCVKAFAADIDNGQFSKIQMFTRSSLYRSPIDTTEISFKKHIGIYAFRRSTLIKISKLVTQSENEIAESLEQLRWLDSGLSISGVYTDTITVSIDTPEDLKLINSFFIKS
jgi:3-deoxy-manno-octulosonate cytidylyltransferase (CMP-KDO synthetase)